MFIIMLSSEWLVLSSWEFLSSCLWRYPSASEWMKREHKTGRPQALKQRLQCECSWCGYRRKLHLPLRHVLFSEQSVPSVHVFWLSPSTPSLGSMQLFWPLLLQCKPLDGDVKEAKRTHVVNISLFFLWQIDTQRCFWKCDSCCSLC